jgi:hypothetical protein
VKQVTEAVHKEFLRTFCTGKAVAQPLKRTASRR